MLTIVDPKRRRTGLEFDVELDVEQSQKMDTSNGPKNKETEGTGNQFRKKKIELRKLELWG